MKAAIKREESQTRLNFPEREQARRSQMLIVIRGAIKAILVDDDKNVIDEKVIRPADGVYGVQLPKNVWHTIECLEPNTCVFEVKEGPFVSHKDGGVLE